MSDKPDPIWIISSWANFLSIWMGEEDEDIDLPRAIGLRVHIGPLSDQVIKNVVTSMKREAKQKNLVLDRIVAHPMTYQPTTHGHQRWLEDIGYDETLYYRRSKAS